MISMYGEHCLCSARAYTEYGNDFGAEYSNGTRLLAMWMRRMNSNNKTLQTIHEECYDTHILSLSLIHSIK